MSPSTVIVHGRRITDARDDDIYVLWIDYFQLVHRSLEQLLEDAETAIEHRLDRSRVPATKSERYYQDITEGYVDIEEFQKRLQGDCYTRIESNMKKNGRLDEDDFVSGSCTTTASGTLRRYSTRSSASASATTSAAFRSAVS